MTPSVTPTLDVYFMYDDDHRFHKMGTIPSSSDAEMIQEARRLFQVDGCGTLCVKWPIGSPFDRVSRGAPPVLSGHVVTAPSSNMEAPWPFDNEEVFRGPSSQWGVTRKEVEDFLASVRQVYDKAVPPDTPMSLDSLDEWLRAYCRSPNDPDQLHLPTLRSFLTQLDLSLDRVRKALTDRGFKLHEGLADLLQTAAWVLAEDHLVLSQKESRLESPETPEGLPGLRSEWSHKNGSRYRVIGYANLHTERPHEYPITIVYSDTLGRVWSRPAADWNRSMKEVAPCQGQGEDQ